MCEFFENYNLAENKANLKEMKENFLNMLECLINSFSKESNAIFNLIKIVIKLNSFPFKNEEYSNSMNTIRLLLEKWFRIEFNQNILVNFGLEEIPQEEIRSNQLLIHIYKNFPQYLQNWANFPFKKFENENEVKYRIKYFGMNNQHIILSKLKNIQYIDHMVKDLFKEQIRYNQLTKCIYFLVNFDFVKYLDNEYRDICLETISDCLIEKNSEKSVKNLCDGLKNPQYQSYLDFIMNEFVNRVWPKSNELQYCIQKPFFLALVSIFVEHSKNNLSNPFNSRPIFDRFNKLIIEYKNLINNFVQGTASLESIKLVNSDQNDTVTNLNNLIMENFGQNFRLNSQNKIYFSKLSNIRSQEILLFNRYRKNVTKLSYFCSKFSLFKPKIDALLTKLNYLDQLSESEIYLNNVCSCINIDQIGSNLNFIPNVTYFDQIDPVLMQEVEKIIDYGQKYCLLFDHVFNQTSKELNVINLNLAKSLIDSSRLTFEKISKLIESVGQGTLKLTELDKIFSDIFHDKKNTFCTEFDYWIKYFNIENYLLRIKQIRIYVDFKNSYLAAVEINKIKQKLNLTNEFRELEKILRISQREYENFILNDMDSNVEQTIECLSSINQTEKLECLKAFTQSLRLVNWLRKNTGNLYELKGLVDFASMSGSNDAVYDRSLFARALKDSGTAYATLIYELKLDVTFHEFMDQCKKVCSHQISDPSIVAKLLEVEDKVEMLDEIKKMNGSVELNSIREAKVINEKGIYQIGIDQVMLNNFEAKFDLNEIIFLDRDGQLFSYSHLKKLQDILMLIMPKKSQLTENDDDKLTLDYFIQFLSSLNQLGQSFLNLNENSCRFFESFQIKIFSNSAKRTNLPTVEINCAYGSLIYTHPELNSLQTLTTLCDLIEKVEQEWIDFVSKKRDANPLLNYFTLKQINFLSKRIELLSKNCQIADFDFEMIQNIMWNVNQNLSVEKILKAYEETLNQMSDLDSIDTSECNGLELLFSQKWKSFLAEQNSVNTRHITLTHFTSILSYLFEKKLEIRRNLPGFWTKTDEPNLISCPNNELMSVILSMYALTSDQPMPADTEIMFCQSNTTIEQVENFIRLCFSSNGSMIFLMVNIHNLTYNVSNRAEKFIKNFIKKPKKFNLAFTCDIQKETESILASVYLKNRVRYLLLDQETLEIYIKRHLIKEENKLFRLGNFDVDNCTVRLIVSHKSGNGKSTYVKHLTRRVKEKCNFNYKIIRIKSNTIDLDNEIIKIIEFKKSLDINQKLSQSTVFHIDIAYEVFNNLEPYLFTLIFSSCMAHSNGLVWRRNSIKDYFVIEITPPFYSRSGKCVHSIIDLLPKIVLQTPSQYAYQLRNEIDSISHIHRWDKLFNVIHKNIEYQRVCFYLKLLNDYRTRTENLNKGFVLNVLVTDEEAEANVKQLFNEKLHSNLSELDCLEILLRIFEPAEPNWLEIRNFVTFLNSQLIYYEKSTILDQVKGFRALCLALMVVVATNFGLPSLQSVQSDGTEIELDSYVLNENRRWENLVHPYMILDSNGEKVTFIGTHMDRSTKQFLNPNTLKPLSNLTSYFIPSISQSMFIELLRLKLRLFNNFNEDHRITKFKILSNIMNLNEENLFNNDPDQKYELALDNCLKMIAIYLRFVCKIPVVLMGETGCGN